MNSAAGSAVRHPLAPGIRKSLAGARGRSRRWSHRLAVRCSSNQRRTTAACRLTNGGCGHLEKCGGPHIDVESAEDLDQTVALFRCQGLNCSL